MQQVHVYIILYIMICKSHIYCTRLYCMTLCIGNIPASYHLTILSANVMGSNPNVNQLQGIFL